MKKADMHRMQLMPADISLMLFLGEKDGRRQEEKQKLGCQSSEKRKNSENCLRALQQRVA